MTPSSPLGIYEFDQFRLDAVERTLWKGSKRLVIGGRAFDVLTTLVRRAGKLVTKEELFRTAWQGRVVEESNIHVQISSLRKLLGSEAISTVSGHGYRLEIPLSNAALQRELLDLNLPTPRNQLVNRAKELGEVLQLLTLNRLVTLKGMGGIGKSRLAIEAALTLTRNSGGPRAWLVALTSIQRSEDLEAQLSRAVESYPRDARGVIATFTSAIKERPTLLIFDGCDQIAAFVATVSQSLLSECAELKIICTSRSPLGVIDEAVYEVPFLDDESARALFFQRAGVSYQMPEVNGNEADLLAPILSRLDGLPLAIELAAAQLRRVGAAELARQVAKQLDSLASSDPSLPKHQTTLTATIEWSYTQLSTEEKEFLDRLSILQGVFSLKAAAGIGLGLDSSEGVPLRLMSSLIDKSLVVLEAIGIEQGYRLPTPIREYAQLELARAHGVDKAERARSEWLFHFIADNDDCRETSSWGSRLQALQAAHPDLLSSLEWLSGAGGYVAAADFASRLLYFWADTGMCREGLVTAKALIEGFSSRLPLRSRGLLLHTAGALAQDLSAYEESRTYLTEAVAALKTSTDCDQRLSFALNELGVTNQYLGNTNEAAKNYKEALDIASRLNLRRHRVRCLTNLGVLSCYLDQFTSARQVFIEALKSHDSIDDRRGRAICTSWLSECYMEAGHLELAGKLSREALDVYRALAREDYILGTLLIRAAAADARLGRFADAGKRWIAALSIVTGLGNQRAMTDLIEAALILLLEKREFELAARVFGFLKELYAAQQGAFTPVRARRTASVEDGLAEKLGPDAYKEGTLTGALESQDAIVRLLRGSVSSA